MIRRGNLFPFGIFFSSSRRDGTFRTPSRTREAPLLVLQPHPGNGVITRLEAAHES